MHLMPFPVLSGYSFKKKGYSLPMLLFLVRVVEWLYVIGVISRSALLHSIFYEIDALCIYG